MAARIEPSEVLAHLNRMGFCGVTAEQLREFISDLKKLMKHDLQQCSCDRGNLSDGYSEFAVGVSQRNKSSFDFMKSTDSVNGRVNNTSDVGSTEQLSQPDDSSYSREGNSASSSTAGFNGKLSGKPRKMFVDTKSSLQNKPNKHKNNPPRSAYIKSWRLQEPLTPRRSDPVALYHKYQTIWQRQKVPGDNAHTGLRWTIREKMLGEDPNPRPMSRTSSVEPLGRHHRT